MSAARFTYRPAPGTGAVTVTLDGAELSLNADPALPLRGVTEAHFVNRTAGGQRSVGLDLVAGAERRTLRRAGPARGYLADPDARAHLAALSATLRALAQARPELRVALGVAQGRRPGMFLVGIGALLGGLVLAGATLATGLAGSDLLAATLPTGFLLLTGAILSFGNWPRRAPAKVSPAALAETLEAMTAGTD